MKTLRLFFPVALAVFLTTSAQAIDANPQPAGTSIATSSPEANVTCKIHRSSPVRYPLSLLRDGVTHGEVRLLINISETGTIADTLPVAYTHEPFLGSAIEAVKKWTYEPARLNNEPVGTVVDMSFRFEVSGVLVVEHTGLTNYAQRDLFGDKFVYKPHGLRTLDRIPTPLHVVQPIYPKEWADQGMRGKVIVDFYIDETGTVRMPSVTTTENPLLSAAAAAAVREWRFAPPLRRGRPVLAHCQQVITFDPEPAKLAAP